MKVSRGRGGYAAMIVTPELLIANGEDAAGKARSRVGAGTQVQLDARRPAVPFRAASQCVDRLRVAGIGRAGVVWSGPLREGPSSHTPGDMLESLKFALHRIGERLWVKPLLVCILSVFGVVLASLADGTGLAEVVPAVSEESIETLLKIVAASMLVMATFAVGSMVSAYASASGSATPRSFPLVIADDVSQNALSTFIGVFIFSIVALVALMNGFYDRAGRFALFLLTAVAFALVVIAFVRWVDRIARLGRLGNTIMKVEAAALAAIEARGAAPRLGGIEPTDGSTQGRPAVSSKIGYVQGLNVSGLQKRAETSGLRITVAALPGAFSTPDRPLALVSADSGGPVDDDDLAAVVEAFRIGDDRTFESDPRFGLVVLSEIASRALSPAVNDPGTAIDVTGSLIRLLSRWAALEGEDAEIRYDRVAVPRLRADDLFDDAFTGIARDGAATIEVGIRLQKALATLVALGSASVRAAGLRHATLALARAENALSFPPDLETLRRVAGPGPP